MIPNSSDVADTWVDRTTSSPPEDRVLREAFWELLAGQPVPIKHLSTRLNLSSDEVEDVLASRNCSVCVSRRNTLLSSPTDGVGAGDVTVQPATAVIAMARAESWEEGIPTVRQETNFLCSPEHTDVWQRQRATLLGGVVSPADAASVGRQIWGQFAQQRRDRR